MLPKLDLYLLYRIVLVVGCVAACFLAYFFVPGPTDTWALSTAIAVGDAPPFKANTIVGLLTTLEVALFTQCSAVLLNHLPRLWMQQRRSSVTPATLDVATTKNLIQLAGLLYYNSTANSWILAIIILLTGVIGAVIHAVTQQMCFSGQMVYPLEATIGVPNTSVFPAKMVFDASLYADEYQIAPAPVSTKALYGGIFDVIGACTGFGGCGSQAINSSATLITCLNGELECFKEIDVYADYHMECNAGSTKGDSHMGSGVKNVTSHTSFPSIYVGRRTKSTSAGKNKNLGVRPFGTKQNTNIEDLQVIFQQPPQLNWTIEEKSNKGGAYVSCSVWAAWVKRMESSVHGTVKKQIVHIYNQTNGRDCSQKQTSFTQDDEYSECTQSAYIKNYTTRDPNSFVSSPNTAFLAAPFVSLTLVSQQLEAISSGDGNNNVNLPCFTTISSPKTLAYGNATLLKIYEQEMRFAVERMYKQILSIPLLDQSSTMQVVCKNCTVRETWWVKEKARFMALIVSLNVFAASMVVLSLVYTIRRSDVPSGFVRVIDIMMLEYDPNAVVEHDAEFKMNVEPSDTSALPLKKLNS
ncbi:hypothetical protein BCR33DRAFT_714321, partial [Rhizoclosmatium globosum]